MSAVDEHSEPGDHEQDDSEQGTASPSGSSASGLSAELRRRLIFAAAGLGIFVAAFLIGIEVGCEDPPDEDDIDVGFAQDMQVHHAQAVMMADIIRDKSTDEEVRVVARDILLGQQAQIGEMRGWLEIWDAPITSTKPPMWWVPNHPQEMPGLASGEELTELTTLTGAAADVLFLELMIEHHDGGVHMAEAASQTAREPVVKDVARTIAESQEAEITYLRGLLDARE